MVHKPSFLGVSAALILCSVASGQTVDGSQYNKPSAGPPASFFAAATTLPVAAIKSAAAKATKVPKSATYVINNESDSPKATIHSDWANLNKGAAYVFVADMDVDCDGIDYKCKGNQDGQSETDNGALAAYEVPWIVIPEQFQEAYSSDLPGNNVAAVICGDKMFYGIYGDSDGDSPEEIGEASWLMARTCFPDDDLNGNSGHTPADVTYIVFTGDQSVLPSSALNKNYITNFTTLRKLGDQFMSDLVDSLNLGSGRPRGNQTARFR